MRLTVCVVAAALAVAGCGGPVGFGPPIPDPEKFTVGVPLDLPGVGIQNDAGLYVGFDIEVARYVAARLGAAPRDVSFVAANVADSEKLLADGEVDFVVANYPMDSTTKKKASLAGPYFVAGQTLLVRTDNYDLAIPDHLDGKQLCDVDNSVDAEYVLEQFKERATIVDRPTIGDCVAALREGEVDAVTGDSLVLAGFAAQAPTEMKVVGGSFKQVAYGIVGPQGDKEFRSKINDALEKMFADGSWVRFFELSVGASGYPAPELPKLDRY